MRFGSWEVDPVVLLLAVAFVTYVFAEVGC